jgi:hypothetical protein
MGSTTVTSSELSTLITRVSNTTCFILEMIVASSIEHHIYYNFYKLEFK